MYDVAVKSRDPDELLDEIRQLRRTVACLEDRVVELDRLAHLDPLVGVANRRGLLRDLHTLIARRERHDVPAAVLFIDVNGLKSLNDSLGHEGGDAALVHVSRQLLSGVRTTDCVARLGGDEFCILLDRADEAIALETANRLVKLVASEQCSYGGRQIPLSVAIGMTLVESSDTPCDVLARADQAMYRDKAAA